MMSWLEILLIEILILNHICVIGKFPMQLK